MMARIVVSGMFARYRSSELGFFDIIFSNSRGCWGVASAKQIGFLAEYSPLLAKAFRGERAPQNPDDEPVSEWLKRFAAQLVAAPKPKRGRKAAGSA